MKATRLALTLTLLAAAFPLPAETQTPEVSTIEVDPPQLTLQVGETASLTATVRDTSGNAVDTPVVFFSRSRQSIRVTASGEVEAYRPGDFVLVALVPKDPEVAPRQADPVIRVEIPVMVPGPPVERVTFQDVPNRFYAATTLRLTVEVVDGLGRVRSDVTVEYATSNAEMATVDRFGYLTLSEPGMVDVTATAGAVSATLSITVGENPVSSLELQASAEAVRTGDVIRFTAVAKDARGLPVGGLPVQFAVYGEPEAIAPGASAHISSDGRFVAERSGRYTGAAVFGNRSALRTVEIVPRDVGRQIEVVGHGAVRDRRTSDLWIWEAADGRDYAITGTWRADGHAYVWDVTDPSDLQIIHEIQVDARTVNDVKVSEDGTIAVISREGASTRRNGIIILGVGHPREGVPVLAEFDDQLTGGVHNLFIAQDHVFALSARRYDIINIEDPSSPYRVGRFELDTPAHGIHDVWVSQGIAFSSNWTDGVVAVDVGGHGGSPQQPVKLGSYTHPNGRSHAAFPYRSKSTGKFYLFAGDEWFPDGSYDRARGTTPIRPAGWIHIVEWDDWENPREVARYQVPEAGSHNLWVEDDILYVAYYNGGLRVVDVSGELMGDLYKQGREIASFLPLDPQGYLANAAFVWGAQPYKGNIFFSDWHSGLWAVKLLPK